MTKKRAYLVIDIGTGNVRVGVAEPTGNILSVSSAPMQYEKDVQYPESIYFDPESLWREIVTLSKSALSEAGAVEICAVTATSQREGIVAIGTNGESLIGMPNIDHRGREWEDKVVDKQAVYQLTGRYPTSLFSALKLIGLKERRPELGLHLSTFLSLSDWAQFKLSGIAGYEHSQASETLLYDVSAGCWSESLCTWYGLDPKILSPLHLSGSIMGPILGEKAVELGISDTAVVVVGGADTQLAIESMNPSVNDVVMVSGTTTPIIQIVDRYLIDPLERTWTGRHTDDANFLLEANAGVTGLNYQRLKEVFYPNEGYDVMESEVAEVTSPQCFASLGSLLADEKTPLIRGGFLFNTPVSHLLSRRDFAFATLWDIACSIFENYKSLCEVTDHQEDYIWACGGGIQSLTLRGFIAGLTGKDIKVRKDYRQSSLIGGVTVCNRALVEKNDISGTIEVTPVPENSAYQDWYQQWKETRLAYKTVL